MKTKYDKDLVEYWYNWKPGMGPFGKEYTDDFVPKEQPKLEVRLDDLADDILDNLKDLI